jgi:hypothetical protein
MVTETSKLIGLRHHLCDSGASMWHYIDGLLPHAKLPLCSYWGYGKEFHILRVHVQQEVK